MSNWKKFKLDEVADIKLSNIDKKSKTDEREVYLCNYTDIYKNSYINFEKSKNFMVATCNENAFKKFNLKKGQVAFTKDSETPDDIGIPSYISEDFEDVVLGYHLSLLTPLHNKLDGKFLNYSLNASHIKKYFKNNAGGSGQRCSLTLGIIKSIPLILPSIIIQKKIGKILYNLDKKIELNNQINQKLEAMAKTLYDYWFIQFDFPDSDGKPYKSSGGTMVYSEELKREIPEGWEVKELSEVIKIDRGISYKSSDITDDGVPMINLNSFYLDGSYKHKGIKYFSSNYNDNKIVQVNDLLIATTDVTRNADIIGKAILIPDIFYNDILMSCDIARVRVTDKLDKYYLEMLFNSNYYHNYIKGFANGTLVLHLNMNGIGWFKTIIPPSELLNKFSSLKKNIEKKKNIILKENQKLTQLRDWLLPMLMNGQVRVDGG